MALPLIATLGLSAAGQGFSSFMAARANKKAEDMLQGRISDLENAFTVEQNQNFLDTQEGAGVMEKLREQMKEISKRNERNVIRNDETAESSIAKKDSANKNYARRLSDLSIYGDQKKDRNAFRYRNMLSSLYNKEIGVQGAKAQNWTQFGNNVSNLAGTTMEAFGGDWISQKEKADETP